MDGDEVNKRAYDIAAYWARSGLAAALTPAGGDAAVPARRHGRPLRCDDGGGDGERGARRAETRTGKGQLVIDVAAAPGCVHHRLRREHAIMFGYRVALGNRRKMGNPAINNYTAGDGRRFWIVGLEAERHWPPLARAVGRPEWLDRPAILDAGRPLRQHAEELIAEIDAIFATRSLDEWSPSSSPNPTSSGRR